MIPIHEECETAVKPWSSVSVFLNPDGRAWYSVLQDFNCQGSREYISPASSRAWDPGVLLSVSLIRLDIGK